MSLHQLYETVIREEEYIMDKRKTFADKIRAEFMESDTQYCAYCLESRGARYVCCEENHWLTFADLPKEDQEILVEEEVELYEEWSRK